MAPSDNSEANVSLGKHQRGRDAKALGSEAPSKEIATFEAALAIAAESHTDAILQLVVERTRNLVGASIAAIRPSGDSAEIFSSHAAGTEHLAPLIIDLVERGERKWQASSNLEVASELPELGPFHESIRDWPVMIIPISDGDIHSATLWVFGDPQNGPFALEHQQNLEFLAVHTYGALQRAANLRRAERHNLSARGQLLQVRQVLDNLPAGVLVVQPPDASVQMTNNSALDMIFRSSTLRSSIPTAYRDFRWLGPEGQELPRSAHPGVTALRGDRLENRQLMIQNAAGENIPVLVQSAPLVSQGNDIIGGVVVFQDFSSIRAAEQIKDDFLSLISHEFRTPLTAIHGGAILLQQQWDDLDNETRHEILDDIGTESSRLDRMLGNLLSVAEIMAGRFQRETEPIVIAPLVVELIDEFAESAQTHSLTWSTDDDLPLAEGDPAWLSQIMRNLYENAIKYSPAGGEIHTEARRYGQHVRISVSDQGLGIQAGHVADVFERFRRPGADPTVRGMGLGLYLSRLLVDAMGGSIHAESDGPGKGSTFTVTLPIVREWQAEVH